MPGILNVSEASAIGLHAVILMAQQPAKPHRVPDMAQRLGVSAAHLQKVLQRLVHAGLADSTRGPKGGYVLAKPASAIQLGKVFEAIEGRLDLGPCLLDKGRCCMGTCVLGDMMRSLADEVTSKLKTRVSDLVRQPGRTDGGLQGLVRRGLGGKP